MKARPIAEGLFREGPPPCLIGGRDRQSGRIVFPPPGDAERYDPCELPNRGRLWSYTVQRFAPKSPPYEGPAEFKPFAVGYVELEGAVIVESRLADVDFDALRIGMPMELTIAPFRTDPDGVTVTTFAFRPAADGTS
ncbi:MAG: OB-fold domain-containing protein [Steroidobacteraceae bacterium]|jgi:uncharacterized OB-fold protein|nr:OB-fold domain-containing protein [Steroidobacteraceae bacterium]